MCGSRPYGATEAVWYLHNSNTENTTSMLCTSFPIPLVDPQLVPEVTHMASGCHLCVQTHGQVHDQPAAVVQITRPNRQTLLSAEGRLPGTRGRVTIVGKGAPVAQHPIGQQLLWWGQGEVCHRPGVEDKRELGAVTGVLVAAG